MRLISQKTPTPRLLSTVVPDVREKPPERVSMRSRLKSVSLFTGNGRAIFIGLVAGAVLICTIGILYKRQQAARQQAEARAWGCRGDGRASKASHRQIAPRALRAISPSLWSTALARPASETLTDPRRSRAARGSNRPRQTISTMSGAAETRPARQLSFETPGPRRLGRRCSPGTRRGRAPAG